MDNMPRKLAGGSVRGEYRPPGRYGCQEVNLGSDYTEAELEFLKAVQLWKESNHCPYPSWREVFHVFISLGYGKREIEGQVNGESTDQK